jgi:hypothetical protein
MLIFATSFVIEKINMLRIWMALEEEVSGNSHQEHSLIFDARTPEQSHPYFRGFSLQEVKLKWGDRRSGRPLPELGFQGQVGNGGQAALKNRQA